MKETLQRLMDLQRSDQALRETARRRDELHKQLGGAQKALEAAQATVETAHHSTQEAQALTHRKELDLKEREDKIDKMTISLNKASSNKEYQAILLEQGTMRAENGRLEEEILISMDTLEEREREEEAARAVQREAEAVLRAAEQKVEDMRSELDAELSTEEARRGEIAGTIDGDLLRRYERIRKGNEKSGGIAVVPVHGEYCQGCQMRITSQEITQLMLGTEIIICRTCQRMLVLEE